MALKRLVDPSVDTGADRIFGENWNDLYDMLTGANTNDLTVGGVFAFKNNMSFKGIFSHANTADRTYTFPDYDATLATLAGSETFTNKTIAAVTFSGTLNIGTNRIVAGTDGTNGNASFIRDSSNAKYWVIQPQNVTNSSAHIRMVPIGTGVAGFKSEIQMFQTDFVADSTNYEMMRILADGSSFIFNVVRGGTGSFRPLRIQMNGTNLLVFNTDNTIDSNSNAWSNLKLGSNLDAGGNRLTKASSLHFDTTNTDTDSNIMGNRSGNLSLCATADGTNMRSIVFRTSTVATAGTGSPTNRMTIAGGSSPVDITISNANLALGNNNVRFNSVNLTGWSADARYLSIKHTSNNTFTGLRIFPNGSPSGGRTLLMLYMTDGDADTTNWERLLFQAADDGAGNPLEYRIKSEFSGTGSTRPIKLMIGSATIDTYNTDNTVDHNARAHVNLGSLVIGSSTSITSGAELQIVQSGSDAEVMLDSYGTSGSKVIGRRAQGTSALPTATLNSDLIARFSGRGYGTSFTTVDRGGMDVAAAENWSATAMGTYLDFYTTANTTTTTSSVLRIHHDGSVAMLAAKKFFLDGVAASGDTYIYESAANIMRLVVGGSNAVTLSTSGVNVNSSHDLTIEATQKFFIDAASGVGGDTYIQESSANVMSFVSNATSRFTIDGSGNLTVNGTLLFNDQRNMQFNTTTGTKIGTATTQKIGFWNATPVAQQTVTGSRGGNAALADLITKLATAGLIVDGTSA